MKQLVTGIINQRKMLIKLNKSGKNTAVCLAIISKLQPWIDAYGKVATENQWRRFRDRNLNDLMYLIPNNKAGENLRSKLINS